MIEVPITTVWDVVADAMDDPGFLMLFAVTILGSSILIRILHNRTRRPYRCRYLR